MTAFSCGGGWRARRIASVVLPALIGCAHPPATTVNQGPAVPPAARVEVVGNTFRITLPDGHVLAPAELVGLQLTVRDENDTVQHIRIDGSYPDPRDRELTLYEVSVRNATTGAFTEFCKPGPDGLKVAFPLAGEWTADGRHVPSDRHFNLTCSAGAIGKCVRFGYKPWTNGPAGKSLWGYHQACVRMVRADYCGDGKGWTRTGTLIDLFDPLGIQAEVPADGMAFEAAWGESGALCVNHVRIKDNGTLAEVEARCPERLRGMTGAACSQERFRAAPELRLMNRSAP